MKPSLERQALKEIDNYENSNNKNFTTVKVKELKPLQSNYAETRDTYSEEKRKYTRREGINNEFKEIYFPCSSNENSVLEEAIDLTFNGIESDELETSPEDILEETSQENTFIDETEIEAYIEEKLKSNYESDTAVSIEYARDIFFHMKHLETRLMPDYRHLSSHPFHVLEMRTVVISWIIGIHYEMNLLPETLFLTINIFDRFFSLRNVAISKMKQIGMAALLLASKYEEIHPPSNKEACGLLGEGTVGDLCKAETYILMVLHYELGWPGPMPYLRLLSISDNWDADMRIAVKYFLEVSILDPRFLSQKASQMVATCAYTAYCVLHNGNWSSTLYNLTGYHCVNVAPIMHLLLECLQNPLEHHQCVYAKYSTRISRYISQRIHEWIRINIQLSSPVSYL
ncbi:meiosis-specific cyclin Rem1 [Schizosaccharomyces cryophilus OY26]|uniref:Meiosis-specific cyclin Rem1 n=1 Tax=Schizosaccharomyces cryophilus (strain OY26 / ATCC MYA-4695 / CBS 11777 / NBRC 106824 / NRRL Y48691) TaxID=653667 RepID=S9XK84_SCHCR|nr:meiosis-specific cyclin Rem1 [Schizosaccharomyces cryophilus OY26]EPY54111.1 meiosis-specific cyclin Rem1 [Schizosaccharomyces cryophilus OY26]